MGYSFKKLYSFKTALTGLALLATTSCITQKGLITEVTYERKPQYHNTQDNLKKNELRRVTQMDSQYNLERVVINEKDLYVSPNSYKSDNELDIKFIRYEDHKKIINDQEKLTRIVSDTFYTPTKVKVKENDQEFPATEISLSTRGKNGKRAQIREYNKKDITTGVIKENQDDALYNIRTIKINGKEWYVPIVEDTKLDDKDALPFYMIEVEGSMKIITPNGEITLKNENGFYRPVKITKKDYETRKPILEPPLKESAGKANAIGTNKTNQ